MRTVVYFISLMSVLACAKEVGDSCASDLECGTTLICDEYSYEGYCTLEDCEFDSCPEGSRCIIFENEASFCMAKCEGSNDCRDGYRCVADDEFGPYCRQNDG